MSNISSNAYFRMTLAEAPMEAAAIIGILSEILSIAAAFFAIKVVKEVDGLQEERARNLQQAFPPPPPPPVFENRESIDAPPETTTSPAPAGPAETSRLDTPNDTSGLDERPDPSNSEIK